MWLNGIHVIKTKRSYAISEQTIKKPTYETFFFSTRTKKIKQKKKPNALRLFFQLPLCEITVFFSLLFVFFRCCCCSGVKNAFLNVVLAHFCTVSPWDTFLLRFFFYFFILLLLFCISIYSRGRTQKKKSRNSIFYFVWSEDPLRCALVSVFRKQK